MDSDHERPKVLVSTSSFPINQQNHKGGGSFVLNLSKALSHEYDIYVLTPRIENNAPLRENFSNISVCRYNFPFSKSNFLISAGGIAAGLSRTWLKFMFVPFFLVAQLFAVRKILQHEQINFVHAHWLIPQGLVAVLYKIFFDRRTKILATSHGSDLNLSFGGMATLVNKFLLKNISALTVVSEPLKVKAQALGYQKEISVIPMGINTQLFKPVDPEVVKQKHNIKGPMLLFVGSFNAVKGIEYLIEAMAQIVKDHEAVTLVLVGDGLLRKALEQRINELEIERHIIFTGQLAQEELPAYYSAADIVLMPSLSEGSPVVLPEAMSCGALVVTSDLPIYKQHITDGENGFIVRQKNAEDIVQKVVYILSNRDLISTIKHKNRQYVIDHFDWNVIAKEYTNLFNQVFKA